MKKTLLLLPLILLTGCSETFTPPTDPAKLNEWIAKNKTTIEDVVRTAAQFGTQKALKEWAKKNPAAAAETAKELCTNINDQLLPYIQDDTKLLTAAEIKQLLSTSLFKNIPDVVKIAIISASAVLDYYLPIPESSTILTENQRDIVAAFLEGIRNGCEDYTPTKTKTIKKQTLPKGSWIE